MDVRNATDYSREIELARQLLREREEQHAEELKTLRERQREQIKNLQENQQQNLEEVRSNAQGAVDDQRKEFEASIEDATDTYNRTLADERRENYNKFGKLANGFSRERAQDHELKSRQMNELASNSQRDIGTSRRDRERLVNDMRKEAHDERLKLKSYYDDKLTEQRHTSARELADTAQQSRARADHQIAKSGEEMAKNKLSAELRYEKLARESEADREKLHKAYEAREQNLIDEKVMAQSKLGREGGKALDEYRERLNDSLTKTINDNNVINAIKEQENARRISQLNHDNRMKEAELHAQIQKTENTLKHQNEADNRRTEVQKSIDERRHKQDLFVSNEGLRKNNETSSQIMREEFNERLHDLDEKNQRRLQSYSQEMQDTLALQEKRAASDRGEFQRDKSHELAQESQKNARERERLVREYETRQTSLEDLKDRQLSGSLKQFEEKYQDLRTRTDREKFMSNREKQLEVFGAREELRSRTEELISEHSMKEEDLERAHQARSQRLSESYRRALEHQQQSHEEASSELRHDATMRMAKMRHDNDHERRSQLIDLQSKNREIVASFEEKLNQLKDDHDAEAQRNKAAHDKEMRETMKKAKELLDKERSAHRFELETKDRQMSEKLKLQEAAFKDQIEKLKRSNELALKKS